MKLVADIGGTNSRFAMVKADGPDAVTVSSLRNSEFGSFDEILDKYLSDFGILSPEQMVIAVAGPVRNNSANLTNLDWKITGDELAHRYQSSSVEIINDLAALGYAIPVLAKEQLFTLVEGARAPHIENQRLVVGVGTGFNVSPVIQCREQVICPSVEAGHASMPTRVARQIDHLNKELADNFPTIEDCFSGRGLQQFFDLVIPDNDQDAEDVVASYAQLGAEKATAAIDSYAELLGHLVRDLSLLYMPTGGIYLAGGVARSIMSTSAAQYCAEVLHHKSRFHGDAIPVSVIAEDIAALIGCAELANANPHALPCHSAINSSG